MNRKQYFEELNYANDHRVQAANRERPVFDEDKMTILVMVPDGDEPEEYITESEAIYNRRDELKAAGWNDEEAIVKAVLAAHDELCGPILKKHGMISTTDGLAWVCPAKYEVCGTCGGKGKHVNPSIDAGGISEDDEFWDDDMDYGDCDEDGEPVSRYASGFYDVTCYGCEGKRVVPVVDEDRVKPEVVKAIEDKAQADAEYEAERRAERRMGC